MIHNELMPTKFDYDIESIYTLGDMSNKLFCTFSTEENLEELIKEMFIKYYDMSL